MQRNVFHVLRLLISLSAIVLCVAVTVAQNTTPEWWIRCGVINTNAAPKDFAALNMGQLKNLAYKAWLEMETLPGGADFVLTFTNGFNNFTAVNMGQLKETVRPFYDRMGMMNHYPWSGSSNAADHAMANIGQAKFLFSFDPHSDDFDRDGMPDSWEIKHGFNPFTLIDASSDFDGDGLTNLQEYQLDTNPRLEDSDLDGLTDGFETAFRRVVAWGDNSIGECDVPFIETNVVAVAASSQRSLALLEGGRVIEWGYCYPEDTNVWQTVTNAVAVAIGASHGLALLDGGRVVAWGYGDACNVPTEVTNAVAIAAGDYRSLAVLNGGRVVAWGYGDACNVPADATNAIAVSASYVHSLALLDNGHVLAWGGPGTPAVPDHVNNVGAIAIATGDNLDLALLRDNTVVTWGGSGRRRRPLWGYECGCRGVGVKA